MTTINAPGNVFDGAVVIHAYTRAQAIEDGVLIDVTPTAREAGFVVPVAVTAALWADITRPTSCQDTAGRLWDVLFMGRLAIRTSPAATFRVYSLLMQVGRTKKYLVKMVSGPGDDGEHVLTLMRVDED